MSEHLFVGGPLHGVRVEVPDGRSEALVTIMFPSEDPPAYRAPQGRIREFLYFAVRLTEKTIVYSTERLGRDVVDKMVALYPSPVDKLAYAVQ